MKVEDMASSLHMCTTLLATYKDTALFFTCKRTMSEMKSCISSILKAFFSNLAFHVEAFTLPVIFTLPVTCQKISPSRQLFVPTVVNDDAHISLIHHQNGDHEVGYTCVVVTLSFNAKMDLANFRV